MPILATNYEWLNHNSMRSYPFAEEASRSDTSGSITIPNSFVVGLNFPVTPALSVDPSRFFLKSLYVFPAGCTLEIGYDTGAGTVVAATTTVAEATHTLNRSYALPGVEDFAGGSGTITIGRFDEMSQLPPGAYTFDLAGGRLEVDCIRPMISCIPSITVVNGSDRSEEIVDFIELAAGANIRLTVSETEELTRITISAISGEGLLEECGCDELRGDPIRTINRVRPGADGNIDLLGNECLVVEPGDALIRLLDRCSTPCCGSDELNALARQLDRLNDGVTAVQALASATSAAVTQLSGTILASRISDSGCISC